MYAFYAILLLALTIGIALKVKGWIVQSAIWWFFTPLLYGYIWNQLSLITIERGYYITEQGSYSEFTGAALRYGMLFLLTILGFRFGTGREVAPTADELKRAAIRGSGINSILLGGCLGVATLLAGNAALSASGWSGPIDRFNWWENSRFPILRMITGEVCWPAVYGIGVGLANAMLSRNRLWIGVAGLAALLYLFFLVRMGQKYNGLIPPLIALVLPIAYGFRIKPVLLADKNASREQLKANRRLIATMAILGAALVATAFGWFSSTWQNSKLAMGAFENFAYRVFVIQGHTYFGADYLHLKEVVSIGQAWDVLRANQYSCIATVMEIVGDPELVQDYTQRGVRYATIHPSISILIGGIGAAVIVSFLIGWIGGIGARFFNVGAISGSVALQYCGLSLVVVAYGLLMMSELSIFASVKFLVPAAAGLILNAMSNTAPRREPASVSIASGVVGAR